MKPIKHTLNEQPNKREQSNEMKEPAKTYTLRFEKEEKTKIR